MLASNFNLQGEAELFLVYTFLKGGQVALGNIDYNTNHGLSYIRMLSTKVHSVFGSSLIGKQLLCWLRPILFTTFGACAFSKNAYEYKFY